MPWEQRTTALLNYCSLEASQVSWAVLQHRDKGAPSGAKSTAPLLCPSTAPRDRLVHTAVLTNNSPSCKLPSNLEKQHLVSRWNGGGEVFCLGKETTMVCAVSRAVQQDHYSPVLRGQRTKRLCSGLSPL